MVFNDERGLFPELTEENIQRIKTHPYYAECMKAVRERCEEYLTTEPARIKYSEMHVYFDTGSRKPFEGIYHDYESRLNNFLFMYIFEEDDKYIMPMADILYNICDFESWSCAFGIEEELPLQRRRIFLNLTSSFLGLLVAQTLYLVGDKLPELVYRRAKAQLRERIIESYSQNFDYWWMRTTLNWAAVCTGNIMQAYLYMAEPNEISEQLPRMLHSLELYISGFDDEGCCPEGYGYWNYGFAQYCRAADQLRKYTKGEIDLFKNPKVHNVALFQQNAVINYKEVISFSDCGGKFSPIPWLCHFLKAEYSDVEIPSLSAPANFNGDILGILKLNPEYAECKMNPKSHTYLGAQWFIYRSDKYNIACKAGYNNEPHNHNDIGSFVISKNDNVTFTDPGAAYYSRQYWENDKRYSFLAASSRGHSVPIIDGQYQMTGKEKCEITVSEPGKFAFDMQCAYNLDNLKRLNRSFTCSDGVTIEDSFEFENAPANLTERFVTHIEPELRCGEISVGESVMVYDASLYDVSVSSESFLSNHSSVEKTVYFIDLAFKSTAKNMKFSIIIK